MLKIGLDRKDARTKKRGNNRKVRKGLDECTNRSNATSMRMAGRFAHTMFSWVRSYPSRNGRR